MREVASGYECGIGLEKFNDIKENDVLEAYIMEEIEIANEQLADMIDLLNVTESERNRILDAIQVTDEKIREIKQSNISELDNHVDFEYL